jgi:hypothetical protein
VMQAAMEGQLPAQAQGATGGSGGQPGGSTGGARPMVETARMRGQEAGFASSMA